jgi:hypothetical protein
MLGTGLGSGIAIVRITLNKDYTSCNVIIDIITHRDHDPKDSLEEDTFYLIRL